MSKILEIYLILVLNRIEFNTPRSWRKRFVLLTCDTKNFKAYTGFPELGFQWSIAIDIPLTSSSATLTFVSDSWNIFSLHRTRSIHCASIVMSNLFDRVHWPKIHLKEILTRKIIVKLQTRGRQNSSFTIRFITVDCYTSSSSSKSTLYFTFFIKYCTVSTF